MLIENFAYLDFSSVILYIYSPLTESIINWDTVFITPFIIKNPATRGGTNRVSPIITSNNTLLVFDVDYLKK